MIRPFTRPLADLFDVSLRPTWSLTTRPLHGFLDRPTRGGGVTGRLAEALCRAARLRPRQSFAYADSHSDLPMLQTVGNPVAVSPDIPLMRAAGRAHWSVVEWKIKPSMPRWALPS